MIFIFGSGFVPNQTQVRVNGISTTFVQVIGSDLLIFLLPAGNANGLIQVTTAQGQVNSSTSFGTALNGLQISGIWPTQGKAGIPVFIFGSGLAPIQTQVSFNLTRAPLAHILDANLAVAFVPQGATTGPVKVTTAQGSALSAIPFTVIGNILPVGTVTYLLADHLGTPRVGTDQSGNIVWRWESSACGDTLPTGSSTMNLRFPGQYYDKESQLHYNWNRYFDPKTCRYITSDPIGLAGGLNTFTYVANNPLRWTDPEGLMGRAPGHGSYAPGKGPGQGLLYNPLPGSSCELKCRYSLLLACSGPTVAVFPFSPIAATGFSFACNAIATNQCRKICEKPCTEK